MKPNALTERRHVCVHLTKRIKQGYTNHHGKTCATTL